MDEPIRARVLFQEAFDFCKLHHPNGPDRKNPSGVEFGIVQIIALADFYNNAGDYETAVNVTRQGARWLDRRLAESAMWDGLADDREFDVAEYPREGFEPTRYHPLDINLRERLAVSRLRMRDWDEAEVRKL